MPIYIDVQPIDAVKIGQIAFGSLVAHIGPAPQCS